MSVAIVSGAARGLGRAFAEKLQNHGYTVLPFDKAAPVTEFEHGMIADVSDRNAVEAVVEQC